MKQEEFRRDLTVTGRRILWLVGGVAILGCLWRKPVSVHWPAVVGLAVWVECLIVLFQIPGFPRRRSETFPLWRYVCWVPVFLIGFILPWWALLVYLGLLVCFETVRSFVCGIATPKNGIFLKTDPATRPRNPGVERPKDPEDGTTLQRIHRKRDEAGKVWMECFFRLEFAEDQKTVTIHIPFWPGFDSPPQIKARFEEDGDNVRLVIRPPHPDGVRIDARRDEPGGPPLNLYVTVKESPVSS